MSLINFQLEENLEREKKVRSDVEKAKRKVESDLKQTQETVEELERAKRELEEHGRRLNFFNSMKSLWTVALKDCIKNLLMSYRKDSEISGLNSKLESEQSLVAQLQKKIKELQVYFTVDVILCLFHARLYCEVWINVFFVNSCQLVELT